MDAIRPIMEIDYVKLITQLCLIIIGLNYFIPICKNLFCKVLGIETKFQREKREQKILLQETIDKVTELSDRFNDASNNTDHLFEEKLVKFYTPYREQSMDIQKDLKDSIELLTKADITRSEQIESVMVGIKELLGDTIDQKYEKYIRLGGIPSDDVDEFNSVFSAYEKVNGNHNRKKKYDYVMDNLPIIPVTTLYNTDKN
mgnify:FL=1|jgi:hypothetical protein|nr:MAG TPA: hypothetical protein [Caudoviricetes sp.]